VYSHTHHHRYWKTEKDIEWIAMLRMGWLYYFIISSPVHGNQEHNASIEATRVSLTSQLSPESQFLQNYSKEITILTHLVVLLTMGLSIYVYFLLFQIWLFHKYIICFDEIVTHYNNKTRDEEVDIPYLFPICCGTAYHKSHHALPDSIILGPGKLKYFNIQYYFIKLFYNITAKVPDKY
jgi:fatty-acid desaturase